MSFSAIALRTLVISSALTLAAHAADFERRLSVSASPDIFVSTGSGSVQINPGSDSEIHIKAHVHAGWNAGGETDAHITRIVQNPPITQSGNTIHIGDVNHEDRKLYNNITIDYEITAPRASALNLRSGSGDVSVNELGRFLKADSGSGSIRAHGIAGPAEMHTGSGDIELQQKAAGEVKTSTGSGSIRLNGINGAVTARTGSGDIEVNGNIVAASRLQSGSGSIRAHVTRETHLEVDAATGSGSIRIPGSSSSDRHHVSAPINGGGPVLEIHTGSGDIEVN